MNTNPKPPSSPKTLITYIICALIMPPVLFMIKGDIPMIFAPILSAIIIAFCIYAYRREKKADTKAEAEKSDFLDDSYFRSSEWREKHLRYTMEHPFEKPDPKNMKADLTKRYRKMASLPITLFGLFMLFGLGCGIAAGEATPFYIVAGSAVSALIIYWGTEKFLALPVKKLYSRTDIDIRDVEASYENGQLLTHKHSGINIGRDYTVIYNEKAVYVIKNSDIRSVTRHITRLKQYQDNLYAGEEYLHKAHITADKEYFVELNEYQVEMAINELNKYANNFKSTDISENYNNQIIT